MISKIMMYSSAIVFGLIGLSCLFFPDVPVRLLGFPSSVKLLIQIIAAGFLAMATLNWIGRNAIYGGIYGKPITLANFVFGLIFTTSLFSAQMKHDLEIWGWIFILLFVVFTFGFIKLLFFPENSSN